MIGPSVVSSIIPSSCVLREGVKFEDTSSFECTSYSPLSEEPVGSVTIQDIPSFQGGYIEGDYMYVFGENDEIFLISLGALISP